LLACFTRANAQDAGVTVVAYKGRDTSKPLLFYISGDGGLNNSFSHAFMEQFHLQDYSLLGLNSRDYFWSKKSPQQAANDIGHVLMWYLSKWKCKDFVLIGYSFGADVTPFIQRCFPPGLAAHTKHIVLMSPSLKTDFEVHLLSMIGLDKNKGMDVADETRKLAVPATIIFGTNEKSCPFDSIKAKNIQTIKLPGGHHYHWDVNVVVRQIIKVIQ